jgi:hypothetical protein
MPKMEDSGNLELTNINTRLTEQAREVSSSGNEQYRISQDTMKALIMSVNLSAAQSFSHSALYHHS